jgi:dienelactone hydrolase
VNYLKKHPPRVDAGWIGIVGFCMGSRIVYLMSAVNADFVKFV